jgi:aspartyl protease family protein
MLEFDGKRHHIGIGEQVFISAAAPAGRMIHLTADARGHFFASGSLNGTDVNFLVDTGATLVSLGAADARRAGIDFNRGEQQTVMTANGPVRVWKVKLHTLRVGDVTLNEVDAAVHERDLPVALLGMSFLNRMEMQREGDTMTLKQRF